VSRLNLCRETALDLREIMVQSPGLKLRYLHVYMLISFNIAGLRMFSLLSRTRNNTVYKNSWVFK